MEKLSVADVLDRAASNLDVDGIWGQAGENITASATSTTPGCHCVQTAIYEIAPDDQHDLRQAAYREFVDSIGDTPSTDGWWTNEHQIWAWNDAPGRTQPEVVAKLREAAAVARERGL